MSYRLSGGCGCGAVRFEITEPLVSARYCHCNRCQRRTGTAASASAATEPGSFHVLEGSERLRAWTPDGGHEKWFCGDCGSALFTRNPEKPSQLGVRLGALDSDPQVRPSYRQFTAYAAGWEAIPDDGLPRYEERAPVPGRGA